MIRQIQELFRYRDVLYMITWRDVKIRYKQTILGFAWAILMPMIIISAGILVKYAFAVLSNRPLALNDIVTVSVKAIPWGFFVAAVRFATHSLIANVSLVTKIYMPREIFPIAAVLSQSIDLLVASFILALLLAIAQIGISVYLLWVPVYMFLLFCLCTAFGLMFSAASLFFRDVKYMVEVVLTFGIFFTPVFYEVAMFGERGTLLLLNPLAPILEGLNDCVVYKQMPSIGWTLYSAAISVGGLAAAMSLFKRLEPAFAESI